MNELHKREMKDAAEQARNEFIRLHPQSATLILRYDPFKHLDEW